MTSAFTVHQALHGYRTGHRLLASSANLSAEDKRFLSVVTDSADVGRLDNWRVLVSGYPLPSGEWYCLSGTWLAGSEARPGAVWTHSLLLDGAAVAAADRLELIEAFQRPDDDDISRYNQTISLNLSDPRAVGFSEAAAELSWAMFEPPASPVELITEAQSYQRIELLMRIWCQLWPERRRELRFAEAPTARKRGDGGEAFDLQIMSKPQGAAEYKVRVVRGTLGQRPPDWARAFADLDRGQPSSLHTFLDAYAPETADPANAIPGLTAIWLALNRAKPSPTEALSLVAAFAPKANAMPRLKADLLSGQATGTGAVLAISELLKAAVELDGQTFDSPRFVREFASLFLSLPPNERADVTKTAVGGRRSAIGDQILDLAARDVETERDLLAPEIVVRLAKKRPFIAATPSTWQSTDPEALWTAVRGARGKALRNDIVHAAISADAAVSPTEIFNAWPESVTATLDSLLDERVAPEDLASWLAAVPAHLIAERVSNLAASTPARARALIATLPVESLDQLSSPDLLEMVAHSDCRPAILALALLRANDDLSHLATEAATTSFGRLFALSESGDLGEARPVLDAARVDVPVWDTSLRLARMLNRQLLRPEVDPRPAYSLKKAPFRALIAADSHAELAQRLAAIDADPKAWQVRELSMIISEKADRDSLRKTIESLFSRLKPF